MEVIKNKRILALVGIVGLILGCFLPYYTVSIFGYTQSISLWGYWEGKVVLVLTLANALFIFQDFIEKYVPQLFNNWVGNIVGKAKNPKFALIPTILVAVFAISLIIRLDVDSEYIKYGLGFWILWVGIISLIGHAIFYKKQVVQSVPQNTQPINYQQVQQPMQYSNNAQQTNYQPNQNVMSSNQDISNLQNGYITNQNTDAQQTGVNMKKYCPNCGSQVDDNSKFCIRCGRTF